MRGLGKRVGGFGWGINPKGDLLPSGRSKYGPGGSSPTTGTRLGADGWTNAPASGGSGSSDADVRAITSASKSTQESAKVDRADALKRISEARGKALSEYGDIDPEIMSQRTQEQMVGKIRDTAEADKASQLKSLQTSFYSGGAPAGAMQQRASDVGLAAQGQVATGRRDIMTQAAEKNFEAKFGLAQAKAGVQTELVPEAVSTLGNTIATVPELGGQASGATSGEAKEETFGRLPDEGNIEFAKRDPKGWRKWFDNKQANKPKGHVRLG